LHILDEDIFNCQIGRQNLTFYQFELINQAELVDMQYPGQTSLFVNFKTFTGLYFKIEKLV